jgi:hypothetical protein
MLSAFWRKRVLSGSADDSGAAMGIAGSTQPVAETSGKSGGVLNFINDVRVISKRATILSFIVVTPILACNYWLEQHFYTVSKELVFEDVKFRLSRAPLATKSSISIAKNKRVIFVSTCIGPEGSICYNNRFAKAHGMYHTAKVIHIVEIGPKTGIIKSITIGNQDGNDKVYTNSRYKDHIALYRQKVHRGIKFDVLVLIAPCIVFLLSSFIVFMWPRLFGLFHSRES